MNSLIFLLKDSQKFYNLVKIWHIIHVREIYTGGERMAKRKSKHDDFITMCEKNKKLYTLATTSTPSCNLYDVIDRNFVISEKSTSYKKSSSRRIAKPDIVFIAYRFRGCPTEEQESLLKQNIGAARFIWNRMLSDYNLMWKELGFTIPMTPADYKNVSGMEWLKDIDSSNLANVQLHLEKARSDYFSGDKGKPRFKKKNICTDSYTTNYTNNNIRIEDDGIRLPKITGPIHLSMHRPITPGGTLKNVTITHEPDGKWYFSIAFEYPAEEIEPSTGLQNFFETGNRDSVSGIGLDMSVPFLYIDSTGKKPSYEWTGSLFSEAVSQIRKTYRKGAA